MVPATTYSGDKVLRMRVVGKFSTSALNSVCGELASRDGRYYGSSCENYCMSTPFAVRETVDTKSSEVSIYPNPADTFVEVKNLKGKGDYKIYSADGRLVQEGKIDGKINVTSLVKGMYVITIKKMRKTLTITN